LVGEVLELELRFPNSQWKIIKKPGVNKTRSSHSFLFFVSYSFLWHCDSGLSKSSGVFEKCTAHNKTITNNFYLQHQRKKIVFNKTKN